METNNAPSSSSDTLLQTLISSGWCFKDAGRIQELIAAQGSTIDSIESELLNLDLRSIGGKCLPLPSVLAKTPYIRGPLVLQVSSSRDVSRSCIVDSSGNSDNNRLLLLKLTDGHSEISAIEYSHVPTITEDVIPGTKVRLQNKADICNGIVCLNSKVITILGGVVQSLHEEWQIKRKYLDISSYSSRPTHAEVIGGPPPFEKLQIRKSARGTSSTQYAPANTSAYISSGGSVSSSKGENSNLAQAGKQNYNTVTRNATDGVKLLHNVGENKEKPVRELMRPKVDASVPVQNQEAAQKLLQKQSQPNYNNRNSRSHRHRGRGDEEESNFLTLDEWERKRTAGASMSTSHVQSGVNQDEYLARQMQQQFDLEDVHARKGPNVMEAKDITMSMFNFERDDPNDYGRGHSRGRGRGGRGRRSRGRGRY